MKDNWIGCFILLSEYYFQGVGVEKSYSEAFRLLNLAANLGMINNYIFINSLYTVITTKYKNII
jgi:TPR repeat protein